MGESLSGDILNSRDEVPSSLQSRARVRECGANGVSGGRATKTVDKDCGSRRIEDGIDRRQRTQTCGAHSVRAQFFGPQCRRKIRQQMALTA
jgi:hypothetical protein